MYSLVCEPTIFYVFNIMYSLEFDGACPQEFKLYIIYIMRLLFIAPKPLPRGRSKIKKTGHINTCPICCIKLIQTIL